MAGRVSDSQSGKISRDNSFRRFLEGSYYRKVFGQSGWPTTVAGLLIGLINIVSYIWVKKPFTVYTGILNWGQHIYSMVGLSGLVGTPRLSPLLEPTSAGDIGVILGAMIASILSNEFRLRGADRLGAMEAVVGGILMALGVSLAFGCNWGGFLSAITSWSLHGYAFLLGALIGGYLGLRYVNWRAEKISIDVSLETGHPMDHSIGRGGRTHSQHYLLAIPVTLMAAASLYYMYTRSYMIGGLLIGLVVGIVLQRSRFCFATAFRDLFGGPELLRAINIHKGIAIAILTGSTGVFALKYMNLVDIGVNVSPVYLTNIVGGAVFIFGAIMVGGCASGILWRVGEGHSRALIGLTSSVLAYPILYSTITRRYLTTYPRIFIPGALGWEGAYIALTLFGAAYLISILYQEYRYTRR